MPPIRLDSPPGDVDMTSDAREANSDQWTSPAATPSQTSGQVRSKHAVSPNDPSSSGSTSPSSLGLSLTQPHPRQHPQSQVQPQAHPHVHLATHHQQHLATPQDLDLTRTPPARTFAPSPPISRTSSELDLGAMRAQGNGGGGAGGGKYTEEGELARFLRTADFAARKHSCQRRKDVDQTPYINHPIAVANFLSSTGVTDVRVLQAAVLHDTVEDTHTTVEEIAQLFGSDVARIVEECTDDQALSGQARKVAQVRSAPFKSREAQQVKLADKMHNLESIRRCPPVGWGIKRIQAYFIWAKQVTDVCAPAHPPLAAKLQELYETAYTRVNGVYYPCHPDVCGPLTEAEKERVDSRLRTLKAGDKVCPAPIFF